MQITPCTIALAGEAKGLIKSVFPSMSPFERMSLVAIMQPLSFIGRAVMFLGRIKDLITFDVMVSDSGRILGTTGLYRYYRDDDITAWVAWFCVDPTARGQGVGQKLLDHTIAIGRKAKLRKLRLYTSTDPNEAAAQVLYERNGFVEVARKRGLFTTTIFRERCM
jgi:ribosomal protein S18 acetylase RimI-like enzyme